MNTEDIKLIIFGLFILIIVIGIVLKTTTDSNNKY